MYASKWRSLALLFPVLGAACGGGGSAPAGSAAADAAAKVYVAPGQKDEFYAFLSGGFSGNVTVYGLPSGRLLDPDPGVLAVSGEGIRLQRADPGACCRPATAWCPGTTPTTPSCRMTDGVPDGRWLFINGNNTPRIARIDLKSFETVEILEIPNSAGNHASPFMTQNSEVHRGRDAIQRARHPRRTSRSTPTRPTSPGCSRS